jgi:hypothetical protein
VEEVAFTISQKIGVMNFVEFFFVFLHVAASGFEGWRVWIKGGNICKRISNNIATNVKFVWEFANNRANFLCDRLVLFLHQQKYIGKLRKVRKRIRMGRRIRINKCGTSIGIKKNCDCNFILISQ